MNLYWLIDRLINYERRVLQVYRALSEREDMPPPARSFWHKMAEDECHHLAVIEHSSGLLNFMASPPVASETVFAAIEATITEAEAAVQQPALSIDHALAYALLLEGSELNSLQHAWLRGFRPPLETLMHAQLPEEEAHLQRLVNAVHTFSTDPALRQQATALWATYQQQKAGDAR
ncbi:MAG: hypothetical protein AB1671_08305 [Thermodesulfobacteriota bacterium]|jgi:hypothetical protein